MEKSQMKAFIFDPYLDTLGGGERYALTFALALVDQGYDVELAWKNKETLITAQERFGLDLSKIILNPQLHDFCSSHSSLSERFAQTSQYDLIFWISDGSLPFLFAKNNLVHFQVPFTRISGSPLINSLKMLFIKKLVYNSEFTRRVVEKYLPASKGFTLYPPIDTKSFKSSLKKKIILSVARFGSPSHSKRQDILIEAFKHLQSKAGNFQLILTGGHKGDNTMLDRLKKQSTGLNVIIKPNPDFGELKRLYARSMFFWHAAGFGIDESKEPEKVEHFGITTVEAMSAGCIPVCIAKGGQKEIITEKSGRLVDSPEAMAYATLSLIENKTAREEMSKSAIIRAETFSQDEFFRQVTKLIQ
jgi:glycosyltransferase involved in cell wall biosynthesis